MCPYLPRWWICTLPPSQSGKNPVIPALTRARKTMDSVIDVITRITSPAVTAGGNFKSGSVSQHFIIVLSSRGLLWVRRYLRPTKAWCTRWIILSCAVFSSYASASLGRLFRTNLKVKQRSCRARAQNMRAPQRAWHLSKRLSKS